MRKSGNQNCGGRGVYRRYRRGGGVVFRRLDGGFSCWRAQAGSYDWYLEEWERGMDNEEI